MQALDITLLDWFNAHMQTPFVWIAFGRAVSQWLPSLVGVMLAVFAFCEPKFRSVFWAALVCLGATWVLVMLFRWAFPVSRPAQLGMGIQWITQGERPSFPSMHATGAFSVAFMILLAQRWLLGAIALVAALLIGWSRLFLGLHFPSDVLGGMVLGGGVAFAVYRGWRWPSLRVPGIALRARNDGNG